MEPKRRRVDPHSSSTTEDHDDEEEEVTQDEYDDFVRDLQAEWKSGERKNNKKLKI